ncbi:MAG: DUF1292 domain-containing protein [Bacilli bacterium]|nr:DUF1292 domain-containing protein [Bacilli bacterium]
MLKLDNQDYLITNEIVLDNIKYYLLINLSNPEDIIIRKEVEDNGERYIEPLDNDEEFDKVSVEFYKNN